MTAYRYLINELVSKEEKLNFKNIKNILEGIVDKYQQYYFIKFMAKQLFLENFYKFNEDQEYDLEFIKRPSSFNSNLYYQEYEDRIDYPLITMIQRKRPLSPTFSNSLIPR